MMKKIIPFVLILILISGLFVYSLSYREKKIENNNTYTPSETHTRTEVDTELTESDLVVENKEGKYKLYLKNNIATLVHGSTTVEFNNWSRSIATKTPEMYYNDFDLDGKKELIIRLVDDSNDVTGKTVYSYVLYLFKEKTVDGKKKLQYITAQSNNWNYTFTSAIKLEVTQLKSCKKYIQFAMNDAKEEITYDEKTGITDNRYVTYACADCSSKKEYYTLSHFNKGLGIYSVNDDGEIFLDIQVLVKYEESSLNYHVGNLHCQMMIDENAFRVKPHTITLIPLDEYRIFDPRMVTETDWSYTVNNLSSTSENAKSITWIDLELTPSSYADSENQYFGNMSSDITKIDNVKITPQAIIFTAKEHYDFSDDGAKNGHFEVYTESKKKTDISYTAEVKTVNKRSTLIINLDKAYKREKLAELYISYGR